MKHSTLHSGFTLIEILLYLGIFTLLIGTLIPFAWTIIEIGQKSSVQQEVFNSARFTSEILKRQIRSAKSVTVANSNFDVNLATNSSYKITLVLPSPDTSAVINVSGSQVMLAKNGQPAEALNSTGAKVTELTFTNYSSGDGKSDNLGFTITLEDAVTSASKTYSASTQLKVSTEMRN